MEDASPHASGPGSFHLPSSPQGGPSRTAQVGSLLARELRGILARGLNDPRYRGLVSILDVEVSKDLADATVAVSVLPEAHGPLSVAALDHAKGHLATKLRERTALRRIPRLHFRLDDRLKRVAAVEQAIRDANDQTDAMTDDMTDAMTDAMTDGGSTP